MKYLFLGLLLVGCSEIAAPQQNTSQIGPSVYKFVDGNVTCYQYYSYSISCVRNDK